MDFKKDTLIRQNQVDKAPQLQHTNIQASVLHVFPVLQVHGPHMAIKQAGRVGDGVLPCTENNNTQLEKITLSMTGNRRQ